MGQYEDTLEDIEKTFGTVPEFMRLLPRESLIREWPSWKKDSPGEIDLERARYLLSEDKLLEETLSQAEITEIREFGRMARTVCCGALVDAARAPMAKAMTGERFLVCNEVCKRLIEKATPEELREIAAMKL
ncbi:MAG: hypothetical protein OIN66_16225 [Candidatus Methanoperedens sp.]|nr:hypothetical protein [Candidatus Methanoperedens sp.]